MNVSLPAELKAYVDQRVQAANYQSSSEYVRELIRRDHDAERLRGLLIEGLESPVAGVADDAYFAGLRAAARQHATGA